MQPAGYDHTRRVATTSGRKENNLPYSTWAVAANARMEEWPANSCPSFCLICNSFDRGSFPYCMVVSSLARNTIMTPDSDHLLPQPSLYSTYYYCTYYSYVYLIGLGWRCISPRWRSEIKYSVPMNGQPAPARCTKPTEYYYGQRDDVDAEEVQ